MSLGRDERLVRLNGSMVERSQSSGRRIQSLALRVHNKENIKFIVYLLLFFVLFCFVFVFFYVYSVFECRLNILLGIVHFFRESPNVFLSVCFISLFDTFTRLLGDYQCKAE